VALDSAARARKASAVNRLLDLFATNSLMPSRTVLLRSGVMELQRNGTRRNGTPV
jgi:hypothetical protein